jgi:hypothetical protein
MLDEQRVERYPVRLGQRFSQPNLGLLRGPCADHAEAVRDAVHVGVDRDRWDPVAEDEDAVRGLGPHAGQRQQLLQCPGHDAPEPLEHRGRARADRARLGVVEAGTVDQRFYRARRGAGETRGIGVPREEPRARDVRRFVARPLGEDRPDQHLERVLRVVAEVGRPPVARVVERREGVEDRLPIEGARVGHPGPLAGPRVRGTSTGSGLGPAPGSERSGSSEPPCASRRSSPMR